MRVALPCRVIPVIYFFYFGFNFRMMGSMPSKPRSKGVAVFKIVFALCLGYVEITLRDHGLAPLTNAQAIGYDIWGAAVYCFCIWAIISGIRTLMVKAPAAANAEEQKIIDQGQAGDEVRFTREQLDTMRGLTIEKLRTVEASKQAVIVKGAHEGKTIATEAVLRRLEAAKAAYQGADRAAYTAAADKLARELREKYPDTIPVDEAYRLMKEWE
jgi:hypothetical protein